MMCGIDFTVGSVILFALQAILIVIAASGITTLLDMAGVAVDSIGASASAVIIAGRENLRG